MNKFFIVLLGLLPAVTNSQIKELYSDAGGVSTTVVIKENQTSDREILSQNFNLDDYKVGDVIRITTAPEEKVKEKIETVKPQEVPEKIEVPSPNREYRSANARIVKRTKKKPRRTLFSFKNKKPKKAKKMKRYKCYNF